MSRPDQTAPRPAWRLASGLELSLDRARVMAVLNATPDSFSDGGAHLDPGRAADAAARFADEGADLLDVGGESTRPGAEPVPETEQIRRVVTVIAAIRAADVILPITIDTTRAAVAAAGLDAGATAVNDQSGGTDDPAMLPLAAERGVGIVLMHRREGPRAATYSDRYREPPAYEGGVVAFVRSRLAGLAGAAVAAGVNPRGVAVDPGLGFGKTVEQNVELMREGASLAPCFEPPSGDAEVGPIAAPLLAGASRKSFTARLAAGATPTSNPGTAGADGYSPRPPHERVAASIACAIAMHARGVRLFRVHDVRAHAEALRVADRLHRP